jgi:hypothetical protein
LARHPENQGPAYFLSSLKHPSLREA